MTVRLALDEESVAGTVVRTVAYYSDGTAVETLNGVAGDPRPQTDAEQARFAYVPPRDRLEVLLEALAEATTLDEVRAAAQAATEA